METNDMNEIYNYIEKRVKRTQIKKPTYIIEIRIGWKGSLIYPNCYCNVATTACEILHLLPDDMSFSISHTYNRSDNTVIFSIKCMNSK